MPNTVRQLFQRIDPNRPSLPGTQDLAAPWTQSDEASSPGLFIFQADDQVGDNFGSLMTQIDLSDRTPDPS